MELVQGVELYEWVCGAPLPRSRGETPTAADSPLRPTGASIWSAGCNKPPVTLRPGAHGAA
jgi:hypothetical protein